MIGVRVIDSSPGIPSLSALLCLFSGVRLSATNCSTHFFLFSRLLILPSSPSTSFSAASLLVYNLSSAIHNKNVSTMILYCFWCMRLLSHWSSIIGCTDGLRTLLALACMELGVSLNRRRRLSSDWIWVTHLILPIKASTEDTAYGLFFQKNNVISRDVAVALRVTSTSVGRVRGNLLVMFWSVRSWKEKQILYVWNWLTRLFWRRASQLKFKVGPSDHWALDFRPY